MTTEQSKIKLDRAYRGLEKEAPDRMARAIRWLRRPEAKWVRLPLGLLFIAAGFAGFLPVLGFEMIPLGLLLLALDIPFLRGPVATFTLWLEDRWARLKQKWKNRRRA